MPNDDLRLLMESMGAHVLGQRDDPRGSMALLITETIKFRNKLKEETDTIFTVNDTRMALEGLENLLGGVPIPDDLSEEQRALARIFIDRLTLFS